MRQVDRPERPGLSSSRQSGISRCLAGRPPPNPSYESGSDLSAELASKAGHRSGLSSLGRASETRSLSRPDRKGQLDCVSVVSSRSEPSVDGSSKQFALLWKVFCIFMVAKGRRLVPTHTDTARDGHQLERRGSLPDVLVVDHEPKFTSALFKEFKHCTGSSLLIGSPYHKTRNTNAKAKRSTNVGPLPTAERRTGIRGYPTPSSPSTMLPRRWVAR